MNVTAQQAVAGRILVVEDDESLAALERLVLERSDYSVDVAQTVTLALAQLRTGIYAAVVLDYQLQEGKAWPVLEAAQATHPPVPVVLVTGQGDEQVAAEAHRRGVADYVVKTGPFTQNLAGAVSRARAAADKHWRMANLANLWQAAADAIISTTLDGTVATWNPAAERLFGRSAARAVGKPLAGFVQFERAELSAWLQEAATCPGSPTCAECCQQPYCSLAQLAPQAATCFTTQMMLRDLLVTVAVVRDIRNLPCELAFIARDVTVQKATEWQLRQTIAELAATQTALDAEAAATAAGQRRYRDLFEGSRLATFLVSPELQIVDVNLAGAMLMQQERAQLVGARIADVITSAERPTLSEYLALSLSGVVSEPASFLALRGDGTTAQLEVTSTLVELESGVALLVMATDVSARAAAEAARDASEVRYAKLLAHIPDMVWRSTLDGQTLFISPVVTRMLGYTPDEVYASASAIWPGKVHDDDKPAVFAGFADLAQGRPFDLKFRMWHKDGRLVWLHGRGVRVQQPDGTYVAEGLASDITEARRLQEQFLQAQRMEAVGQLTAGIAHDFNNLLSAILASSSFIADDLPPGHPSRSDALEIKAAAESSARLTRQLLAFSRKQRLSPTLVDVNETLTSMERLLRRTVSEDIFVHTDFPAGLPLVLVDVGQLEQVILNLVVNARDAMPHGGDLHLATANAGEAGQGELAALQLAAGQYLRITVRDTGTGMDWATRSRIFEPFFTTKEVGKGTGLGLSTCLGIVQQSGGAIVVDSERGVGTTFHTYLPCAQSADLPQTTIERASPLRATRKSVVLVVEDNAAVLRTVQRTLVDTGYEVVTATNLAEAKFAAQLLNSPLDLVICDLVMAGGSGPEVIAALRQRQPRLRAILMSGYADHPLLAEILRRGDVAFLQKPFEPNTLNQLVADVLTR